MSGQPDPRPAARIEDRTVTAQACLTWRECACCGKPSATGHHVLSRSGGAHARGDDSLANIVPLCGSGTTGCHGLVEANQPEALYRLGRWIRIRRPDTFDYLTDKLGSAIAADAWLTRRFA